MFRNMTKKAARYIIFKLPEEKKGAPDQTLAHKSVATEGLARPSVLWLRLLIPAMAKRSSGLTTPMVYDCFVGTSICEKNARASQTATAVPALGMKGSAKSRALQAISSHLSNDDARIAKAAMAAQQALNGRGGGPVPVSRRAARYRLSSGQCWPRSTVPSRRAP